jgi:hypothetical protein
MGMKWMAAFSATMSLTAASLSAQDVALTVQPGQWTVDHGSAAFRVPIEAKVIKGAPYSAEVTTESIQTLSDGNRIVQRSTARVYRDSAGRIRREEDRPSGYPSVSITDPVAGTSFSLDSENRTAFQIPNMAAVRVNEAMRVALSRTVDKLAERLPGGAGGKAVAAAAGRGQIVGPHIAFAPFEARFINEQTQVEALAARDVEGVRAEGVRRTTTIPAGEIGNDLPIHVVSEEWFSPELQVLVSTERSDPRLGTSTYRVTNINRTEPASYLFEIPADYTVRPMEMFRKLEPARPPR